MVTNTSQIQTNPPDPTLPQTNTAAVGSFSEITFAQRDPAGYKEYKQLQDRLYQQYIANGADPDDAFAEAQLDAKAAFLTQDETVGAATVAVAPQSVPQNTEPQVVNPSVNPQAPSTGTPAPQLQDTRLQPAVPITVNNPPDPLVPTNPGSTVTTVSNLNEGRFRARDPEGYANFLAYQKEQQQYEVSRLTKLELEASGRTSLTATQRARVNADAAEISRRRAIQQYAPQIEAADAAIVTTTVVPPRVTPVGSATTVDPAVDPNAKEFTNNAAGAAFLPRRQPTAAEPSVVNQIAAAPIQPPAAEVLPIQAPTTIQSTPLPEPPRTDHRVRLRLANNAQYLYKSLNTASDGILYPLLATNGVIFPYTPQIVTNYVANYSNYDLTHSNYRGYFYQNSYMSEIQITGTFTAQDTQEANYLMAVIHFFKSVTKMFYGQQDTFRGAPPPLVYLDGYGEYQFSGAPCLVQNFNYNLPADVDYIKAYPGTTNFSRSGMPVNTSPSSNRLQAADLAQGGYLAPQGSAQSQSGPNATWVPTKMDIAITLLPVQTRAQVSQVWSMKDYSSGNLVKRGFW